ncbi:uncharacterized protein [Lolium perenne]|uniref:uncharacterized protein isoform X2 n=1 Tax=Lolium perenne TaxID=4522 RepID=UPI0021F5466A|nr:uncharacterized protein LOC127302723 isoform X2 [Lolium perenne]
MGIPLLRAFPVDDDADSRLDQWPSIEQIHLWMELMWIRRQFSRQSRGMEMQDQQVLVSDQQALNAFEDELPIQLGRTAVDGADQPVDEDPVAAVAPQQQAGKAPKG